jgi:hypothetical protein
LSLSRKNRMGRRNEEGQQNRQQKFINVKLAGWSPLKKAISVVLRRLRKLIPASIAVSRSVIQGMSASRSWQS